MKAWLSTTSRNFLLTALLGFLATGPAQASPCCAGGSSVPGLITGDDRYLLATSFSLESSDEAAGENNVRAPKSLTDGGQTLALRGTAVFFSDFQLGVEVPWVRRYQGRIADSGLGDLSAVAAYEWLSDITYSAYRPKIYFFARALFPTGRSVQEIDDFTTQLPRGKGFWEWGGGVLAIKRWGRWDAAVTGQANWILPREFSWSGGDSVHFGGATSWSAGGAVGYLFRVLPLRLAVSLNYLSQSSRTVTTNSIDEAAGRSVYDLGLQAGYRWSDEWATTLVVSDQKLLPASNFDLNRSITLTVQRNFPL